MKKKKKSDIVTNKRTNKTKKKRQKERKKERKKENKYGIRKNKEN